MWLQTWVELLSREHIPGCREVADFPVAFLPQWFAVHKTPPQIVARRLGLSGVRWFLLQIDRVGEGLDLMVAVPYLVLYLWCQHLCFKVFLGEFVFVAHRG